MPRGGVPVPFVGGVYEPNSTIAEMIMRAGQQQAQGQREMFGGLANTIGQLGQIPAQMAEQKAMEARTKLEESRAKREEARIQQQDEATKAKAERDAKFSDLLKQGEPDPKSVLDIYGPEDGLKLLQGLHAYRELDTKKGPEAVKSLPNLVRAMDAVSEPFRAELYPAIRQKVVATGLIPPDQASQFLPEQYDPARWPEISKMALGLEKPAEAKEPKLHSVTVASPTGPMSKLVTEEELKKGVPTYQKPEKEPRPVQQRLTKDERQDFASWNYSLPKLDSFAAYVKANPDKWGKLDAFVQSVKQQIPGLADADYASKQALVGRLNAEIRHALFGAALTEGEKESAKEFMINAEDQPNVVLAKLSEASSRARSSMEYYRSLGFNIPGPPGAAPKEVNFNPKTMKLE